MHPIPTGLAAVAVAGTAMLSATSASAADLIAITDQREIVYFSDADPGKAVRRGIHGTGGWMVGVDVRPADGMAYGLTSEGALLAFNAATGVASFKTILSVPLDRAPGYLVDFNPAADRLRVVSANGQNLRVDVDTGHTIVDGPVRQASGAPARVMAGAYTNSVRGASATQLYVFDGASGTYALQNPPNDGTLQPIGPSQGLVVDAADIVSDGTRNVGFLVAANVLYAFDPTTGAVRPIGPIGGGVIGKVIDIAVLPPRP